MEGKGKKERMADGEKREWKRRRVERGWKRKERRREWQMEGRWIGKGEEVRRNGREWRGKKR